MSTGRDTKLTGAIGEFLVSAELSRRGLLATPFSGNVPYYDIIASDNDGGHVVIQVKAINKQNWQFDVKKYAKIIMEGNRQIIGNLHPEPYPNLYCAFVALGDSNQSDRYFIFSWMELRDTIINNHKKYLNKHGGVRPKAPNSTHCSVGISELAHFQDNWDAIINAAQKHRPSSNISSQPTTFGGG